MSSNRFNCLTFGCFVDISLSVAWELRFSIASLFRDILNQPSGNPKRTRNTATAENHQTPSKKSRPRKHLPPTKNVCIIGHTFFSQFLCAFACTTGKCRLRNFVLPYTTHKSKKELINDFCSFKTCFNCCHVVCFNLWLQHPSTRSRWLM